MAVDPKAPDGLLGRRRFWIIGILILLTLAGTLAWWIYWSRFVWTDDARIDGDMALIGSKIEGRITALLVKEGDRVEADQVVARLDDREIRETVNQMRHDVAVQGDQVRLSDAERAGAEARLDDLLSGARSEEIAQAEAQLREADAGLIKSKKDWGRFEALFKEGMIASEERDRAYLATRVAEETRRRADEQVRLLKTGERPLVIKKARIDVDRAKAAASLARSKKDEAEAALRRQEEILRATIIRAGRAGTVARKDARVGEVVGPGQPMYHLLEGGDLWVAANVEETEIGRVRIGLDTDLAVDSYPGVSFHGTVFYVSPAAMSVFSLFPAQNAPGTFVKVTQRIPVKISIDRPRDPDRYPMRPGMSVEVKIRVHRTKG
jgi:membrane fusion protein (multidrug efflux system)